MHHLFRVLVFTQSHYVAQVGLNLMTLLPQPAEHWDGRYVAHQLTRTFCR